MLRLVFTFVSSSTMWSYTQTCVTLANILHTEKTELALCWMLVIVSATAMQQMQLSMRLEDKKEIVCVNWACLRHCEARVTQALVWVERAKSSLLVCLLFSFVISVVPTTDDAHNFLLVTEVWIMQELYVHVCIIDTVEHNFRKQSESSFVVFLCYSLLSSCCWLHLLAWYWRHTNVITFLCSLSSSQGRLIAQQNWRKLMMSMISGTCILLWFLHKVNAREDRYT